MTVALYSPWGVLPAPEEIPFLPPVGNDNDRTASTCANWDDGRCETCGAAHDGYRVDPRYRCPGWRSRQG